VAISEPVTVITLVFLHPKVFVTLTLYTSGVVTSNVGVVIPNGTVLVNQLKACYFSCCKFR
jgi:hypothetical protein